MASAAMLRSAARSLSLRRPLPRRFLSSSSSAPTDRHKRSPSSGGRLKGTMEQHGHVNEQLEDIYKRLLIKVDMISDGMDRHTRLLNQLEVQIKGNNNKHAGGTFDLTPWVVSTIVCVLYNSCKG